MYHHQGERLHRPTHDLVVAFRPWLFGNHVYEPADDLQRVYRVPYRAREAQTVENRLGKAYWTEIFRVQVLQRGNFIMLGKGRVQLRDAFQQQGRH